MKLTFWGTRGSIPAPGPGTVRVGGNTTCLEVTNDDESRIIVDSGTGIRPLGLKLVRENDSAPITMLFTHSHWDHLAGFTFFVPAYQPAYRIDVFGNRMAMEVIRRDILERHDNRYFPVSMDNFRAAFTFHDEFPDSLKVDNIAVDKLNLNHPGSAFAYRFASGSKRVVFATDNELLMHHEGGATTEEMREFCRDASLLIHDGQYLPSEIDAHRGWGHSTYEEVADLAHQAGVPHILFTHHDPERVDDACEALLGDAEEYCQTKGYNIKCGLALEGLSITL